MRLRCWFSSFLLALASLSYLSGTVFSKPAHEQDLQLLNAIRSATYASYRLQLHRLDSQFAAAHNETESEVSSRFHSAVEELASVLPSSFGGYAEVEKLFVPGVGGKVSPNWDKIRRYFSNPDEWFVSATAGCGDVFDDDSHPIVNVVAGKITSTTERSIAIWGQKQIIRICRIRGEGIRGTRSYCKQRPGSIEILPPNTLIVFDDRFDAWVDEMRRARKNALVMDVLRQEAIVRELLQTDLNRGLGELYNFLMCQALRNIAADQLPEFADKELLITAASHLHDLGDADLMYALRHSALPPEDLDGILRWHETLAEIAYGDSPYSGLASLSLDASSLAIDGTSRSRWLWNFNGHQVRAFCESLSARPHELPVSIDLHHGPADLIAQVIWIDSTVLRKVALDIYRPESGRLDLELLAQGYGLVAVDAKAANRITDDAIALAPDAEYVKLAAAALYSHYQRMPDALRIYDELISKGKDRSVVALAAQRLGILKLDSGEIDAAVDRLQQSRALNPGDSTTLFVLGGALMAKGRNAEAISAYEGFLKLEPAGGRAAEARKRLEKLAKVAATS